MLYELNNDELKTILDFVNNDTETIAPDVAQRFLNISFAFQSKMFKSVQKEKARANRAETNLQRLREKLDKANETRKEQRLLEPVTELEKEIPSGILARCIMYLLTDKNIPLARNKVQYLMYEAYCSWLKNNNQHIVREHPVAQAWGPHFWSAAKTIGDPERKAAGTFTYEDFSAVASLNSGVAAYLRNMVSYYGEWTENALKDMFIESFPYKNALPVNNDGKWGKAISDDDIRRWMNQKTKETPSE